MANLTYARNPFGQYVRARTGRGGTPWHNIGDADAAWIALTDEQRAAWYQWSAELSRRDNLGQPGKLNGHQAFVRQWLASSRASLTPLVAAPSSWSFGSAEPDGFFYLAGDFTFSWLVRASTGAGGVAEYQTSSISSLESMGVTRPPGRGHYWRLVSTVPFSSAGPESQDVGFSFPPLAAGKIWCRGRVLDSATRRCSPWVLQGPAVSP